MKPKLLILIVILIHFVYGQYDGALGPRKPEGTRYADQLTKNNVNLTPTTPKTPIPYGRFDPEPTRSTILSARNDPPLGTPNLAYNRDRNHPFYERNKLFDRANNQHTQQQPQYPPTLNQNQQTQYQRIQYQNQAQGYQNQIHQTHNPVTQFQNPVQQVHSTVPENHGINVQVGSSQTQMAIGRFSTNTDRFATSDNGQNRIVLPIDMSNASLDTLVKKTQTSQVTTQQQPEPMEANSRLLVNPQQPVSKTPDFINNFQNPTPTTTPYPAYPDHREGLFPKLANFWHEDQRPASGDRLGPQGRFGGGTNEYREDIRGAINDRRMPWEKNPSSDLRNDQKPFEPLNKYNKNVAIETINYPNPVAPESTVPKYGDNKIFTDPFSTLSKNRHGKEYPEFTTRTPEVPVKSSYIGVPLYPEYGIGHSGVQGSGPAVGLVNSGIVRPREDEKIQIPLNVPQTPPTTSNDRTYYGPEEITRSRYRNMDQSDDLIVNRHRHVKLDLLNE
ncbi:unnamed protein product [Bursaphelenchus okinawaensis]|uniref:Uncharacterized protein n=1 Tax=Bursaphelenchus okinawaensis TaxID=465554 RepID=A0A811K8X9_9BILA|nr:unnamed protein product [Bursaphelenchus okinawaensis]CAG9094433.1 unnamed protein product [Bursaphelenchus okinawaensis]